MKIAIFVVFLRFYLVFFFTNFNILLLILCIGSLIVGLFGALVQKNIKRFLAYSSINQLGFFTLGLVTKTQEGFSFTLVGFLIYNITLIFILFILNYLKTYKNKEINFLTDLKNLYIKNPIIAFLLLVIICSFAGIPPFIGFLSKFAILLSLLNSNYYFVVFFVLFLSLLSSYYYLKIIKLIFFEFFNKSNFSKMSSFFLNYPISRTSYSFYLLNFFFFFVIIYSFIYF
jgi:NADH-quinone oxidoreductase subunit N